MNDKNQNSIAVRVQILYLLNLLVIPGIAFFMIYTLYKEHKETTNELTRSHVSQVLVTSILAGVLIVGFSLLMLIFGSMDNPYTWMWIVLYITCVHASFVLLGVYALVKAMGVETFRYPLVATLAEKLKGYEPTR